MIFPPKVLEQHIAILGKTGSGKTVTAKGIVETLLKKKERVCVIDPVAAWWGLRSDASGTGEGFPVVIFGGQHGDAEIGGSHGAAVAEIVATSDTPTIIDLKLMSVKARTQFFIDFAVTIMQKNQGVLHMVIDEAHLFAPKGRVNSNQAGEMLSETNNMVTGGRGIGLRFILLTQRPAKLHNDCLASIETLVAQRLTLGADRDAIETWIKDQADLTKGKEILASLPSLKTGEGWVWSPEADILERTTFPMITTFDSSNPKNLHRSNVRLKTINLPEIRNKLEKAAGDVVNDDPVQLKRLLSQARAELSRVDKKAPVTVAAAAVDPAQLEKAFERGAESVKKELAKQLTAYGRFWKKRIKDAVETVRMAVDILSAEGEPEFPDLEKIIDLAHVDVAAHTTRRMPGPMPVREPAQRVDIPRKPTAVLNGDAGDLSGPAHKILAALGELEALRFPKAPRTLIALRVGYTNTASTGFAKAMSNLSARGLITYPNSSEVALTDGGRALAPYPDHALTAEELQRRTLELIGGKKAEMLSIILRSYPRPVSKDVLMQQTGYTNEASTGFAKGLSTLSGFGLIDYPERGMVRAKEFLFLETK